MADAKTFRGSRSQTFSISRDEIERADDFGEIFDIAETLGVDLTGLDEINDMKTRLLLYYKKCEGEPNYKDVICDSMMAAYAEDKRKRFKLIKLLTETRDKLSSFTVDESGGRDSKRGSDFIKGFLKSEGTIQNLDIDIENKLDALKCGDCTIVVSGETSAGKSSILNLLFGEEVLATHHASCTSVITRILYHRQRRAKIVFRNGKIERMKNIPKGGIRKCLEPYLFVKDDVSRDKTTLIKEVVIYLPAKILECGLVVVDSPGIGENAEMDKVVMNFVCEQEINAFIYAIKSDHAGGVDEDRLLVLLKLILEKEKEKTEQGMLQFDPQCALFVCNLWDYIAEDQDELVFNHAYQKLKSLWPNMTKSQMIKFSAFKAKLECDIDPYFITDNYKELLNNFKELYFKAMDKRIRSTYRWLETILKRSVHHLKTIVHRIDNSEKDLETKMRTVWGKLNTLKMKSEIVINDLRKQIEEETVQICEEFRQYLDSPKTKMSITSWIESELPNDESFNSWSDLKENLNDLTLARISKELENWEEDNGQIKAVRETVERSIQFQLNILEEELQDIEDDLQSETYSINSDEFSEERRDSRRFSIPNDAVQMQTTRVTLPVKLANRILKPFGKVGSRASIFIADVVNEGKLKEYRKDPIAYAKRKSEKALQTFLSDKKNDHLKFIISTFMEESKQFLLDIQRKLPAMVETNQNLMDHICKCRKEGLSSREMYEYMMEGLEQLKRTLSDYGAGYIFVNDFGADDIQIVTDTVYDGRASVAFDVSQMLANVASSAKRFDQKQIPRGLWAARQNGILLNKNQEEPVTIRIYLPSARIQNTDTEVAKLRLMKHEHVAELLGIQNSNHPTPAFVFSGNLQPLGRFLKSRMVRIKDDVPRILKEILLGLEYIHKKKMVHMELNLNTVTIDDDISVKLCGACHPKVAPLPDDKDAILVGDFVYISPEVLKGELYVSCADIYSFGLLLFEVLVGSVFQNQRQWSFKQFIDNCQPCVFNGMPYSTDGLLESTKESIQDCLSLDLEKRPSIEHLMKSVDNIKHEPVLSRMKEIKRNHPMEKVRSKISVRNSPRYDVLRKSRLEAMGKSSSEEQTIEEQYGCIDYISMPNTERLEQRVVSGQVQLSEEERGPQAQTQIKKFVMQKKLSESFSESQSIDIFGGRNSEISSKSQTKDIYGSRNSESPSQPQTRDLFEDRNSEFSSQSQTRDMSGVRNFEASSPPQTRNRKQSLSSSQPELRDNFGGSDSGSCLQPQMRDNVGGKNSEYSTQTQTRNIFKDRNCGSPYQPQTRDMFGGKHSPTSSKPRKRDICRAQRIDIFKSRSPPIGSFTKLAVKDFVDKKSITASSQSQNDQLGNKIGSSTPQPIIRKREPPLRDAMKQLPVEVEAYALEQSDNLPKERPDKDDRM